MQWVKRGKLAARLIYRGKRKGLVIKVLDPDPGLFRRKRSSGVCEAGYGLAIEDRFPVGAEGFEKDVFDGQGVLVVRVGLATDLGLADVDPVGGTKAGVAEARGFAEGFQHSWVQVIAAVQVGGQAAFDLGEQVRGEVRDPDPGQDGYTIPTLWDEEVTVHYRFHPLAGQRVACVGRRSLRGDPVVVVADGQGKRYHSPLWMTLPEASQWGLREVSRLSLV